MLQRRWALAPFYFPHPHSTPTPGKNLGLSFSTIDTLGKIRKNLSKD